MVVEAAARALALGLGRDVDELVGIDGAVVMLALSSDFDGADRRVPAVSLDPAGRALFAFAGADDFDEAVSEFEPLDDDGWPLADPVSADATAAPATMAAPTPKVTAPAFNHIRVVGTRRAPTSSS